LKQGGGGKGNGGKIVYQIGGGNTNTIGAQQTPTVGPNQPIVAAPIHAHAQHNQPVVMAAPVPVTTTATTTMPPSTQGYVVQQPNTVYHSQPNATPVSYVSNQLPQQVVQAMVMTSPSAPPSY
jgi:hypothetical protein